MRVVTICSMQIGTFSTSNVQVSVILMMCKVSNHDECLHFVCLTHRPRYHQNRQLRVCITVNQGCTITIDYVQRLKIITASTATIKMLTVLSNNLSSSDSVELTLQDMVKHTSVAHPITTYMNLACVI